MKHGSRLKRMRSAQQKKRMVTPDGRYFIVNEILWRCTNPNLSEHERQALVKELMTLRRRIRDTKNEPEAQRKARYELNEVKIKLGERGPVWWDDGVPDLTHHKVKGSIYEKWFCKQIEK